MNNWLRLGFTEDDVRKPGSDKLIDAVVAYGTPEDIAKRLGEHLEAGADHVAIQVLGGWTEDTLLPALSELAGPLGLTPPADRAARLGFDAMRLLVTGGAGFIGANFVHSTVRERPEVSVTVLDAFTYAGRRESLADVDAAIRLVEGDITDTELVSQLVAESDAVVHFAAESNPSGGKGSDRTRPRGGFGVEYETSARKKAIQIRPERSYDSHQSRSSRSSSQPWATGTSKICRFPSVDFPMRLPSMSMLWPSVTRFASRSQHPSG